MLRMLVVDLLLLLGPGGHDGGHAGGTDNHPLPPPTHVFLLAGQSNMAGRGGVSGDRWDGNVPPECRPNQNILRLSAALRWEEAVEPLHADIDVNKTNGVGPGMAFANAVLAAAAAAAESSSEVVVGLVPCAVGGTNISQWERGGWLYENLLKRAAAAGTAARAVLWYQGESDTATAAAAAEYEKKMKKMVRELRRDLQLPHLPIIQVALASGEGPYLEKVREAQLGLKLSNVVTVDAKGLPLQADKLHLTTEGQVQLGTMLAQAYLDHFPIIR